MSPDVGTVGQWDSWKTYDLCFVLSQEYGTVGRWDTKKLIQLGYQSILVLHSLCPQIVGRRDSGTAGQHMTRVFFCPKNLRQWDGGTQEKHVQLDCQSILVLHSLCPQMVGGWDSGTAEKTYDLCFLLSQEFGTVGRWDTRITCTGRLCCTGLWFRRMLNCDIFIFLLPVFPYFVCGT